MSPADARSRSLQGDQRHHGHLVGDHVLIDFVGRVQNGCCARNSFGRFGGENSSMLLPGTEPAAAMIVANAFARATAGANPGSLAYTVVLALRRTASDDATVDEI